MMFLYQKKQYLPNGDSIVSKCVNCGTEYPAKYGKCYFCGSESREWTIDLFDESQQKELKKLRRKNNGKLYGRSRKDAGR